MTDGKPDQETDLQPTTEELYEDAPCALLSTQPDGTITRANRTFLSWLGLPPDAVVGTRFQTHLSVGSRIYYETHYAPLLQMQRFVHEIALEMRVGNGDNRPVIASARQRCDSSGAAIENRIALFDATDRRRYERELLHARKTAEQAARELAAADQRKNDFIALLAHELRNPLAPIRGAVDILRRSEHANDLLERTSEIMMRQVSQLTRLVDDLLDVSRLGQDKLSIKRVPIDLRAVVYQAAEASRSLFDVAGIEFVIDLPESPISMDADAARLVQVFENLLNNAAKFTPRGGTVTLSLRHDGDQAFIRVRDTGIGIDPARLTAVFDMFMQGVDSSRRQDGLGIGLTLAKSLVERHGGKISVNSDGLGRGSEFIIVLPVARESLVTPAAVTPSSEVAPTESRRVLVVDDNADSAEMIGLLLKFAGHEVQIAHDGDQALARIASFLPRVVLLDIGLPTMNGYEVAQRIRSGTGPQPLLVALTGWGQEEDRRRSMSAGFDAHLVKPVDHDELLRTVAGLLVNIDR